MKHEVAITAVGPFSDAQVSILGNMLGGVELVDQFSHAETHGVPVTVRGGRPISALELSSHKTALCISAGTGMENIEACEGTTRTNCPGANSPEVAAHAWALRFLGPPITSKERIGIIGPGNVGVHIAQLALALGHEEPQFVGSRKHLEIPTADNIGELVRECGTIFVATGARDVIGQEHAQYMQRGQAVVNVGRGRAISMSTLQVMLSRGVAIGLDVWPEEPIVGAPIPESMRRLVEAGVWGTMHAAAQQPTADERVARMVADTVIKFGGDVLLKHTDPIERYLGLRSEVVYSRSERRMFDPTNSPDVTRVIGLSNHLRHMVTRGTVWESNHLGVSDPSHLHSLLGLIIPKS